MCSFGSCALTFFVNASCRVHSWIAVNLLLFVQVNLQPAIPRYEKLERPPSVSETELSMTDYEGFERYAYMMVVQPENRRATGIINVYLFHFILLPRRNNNVACVSDEFTLIILIQSVANFESRLFRLFIKQNDEQCFFFASS